MAIGDARRYIANAANRFYFEVIDTTTNELQSGTLADIQIHIAQDTTTYMYSGSGYVGQINVTGWVYVDAPASDCTGSHVCGWADTSTANRRSPSRFFQYEPCVDSGVAQGGSSTGITLRSAASGSSGLYVGNIIEIVRGTGAGQTRVITAYNGTTKVATIEARGWVVEPDNTSVYLIKGVMGYEATAGILDANLTKIYGSLSACQHLRTISEASFACTIPSGTPTLTSFVISPLYSGTLSLQAGAYIDSYVVFSTGALKAATPRRITGYDPSTYTITVSPAYLELPSVNDQLIIIGRSQT